MSLVIMDDNVARSVERVVAEQIIKDLELMLKFMFHEERDTSKDITRLCRALEELGDQNIRRKAKLNTPVEKVEVNF